MNIGTGPDGLHVMREQLKRSARKESSTNVITASNFFSVSSRLEMSGCVQGSRANFSMTLDQASQLAFHSLKLTALVPPFSMNILLISFILSSMKFSMSISV